MLDYARQRAAELLNVPRQVVLVTNGPTGPQVGEFPCEALGLELFLLLPGTCDHLFNLEHERSVALLSPVWELKGEAQVLQPEDTYPELTITREPDAKWGRLVRVSSRQMQVRRAAGWGSLETLDLS